jgi:hypothetical protein
MSHVILDAFYVSLAMRQPQYCAINETGNVP